VKVALIALPGKQTNQMPPLTLAYVAAVLEQRRIIVRMYDHALDATGSWQSRRFISLIMTFCHCWFNATVLMHPQPSPVSWPGLMA
jgi:hypothetical protein